MPERLVCDPQPHGRRFTVIAHQDEIIHHPEDRQVLSIGSDHPSLTEHPDNEDKVSHEEAP